MTRAAAPSVLLATSDRFPFPARLAIALAAAGFQVEALCPRSHFLGVTTCVRRIHRYHTFHGPDSLRLAILRAAPDLVIPCDDLTRLQLHQLHKQATIRNATAPDSEKIRTLIERSLGDPAHYPILESRARLLTLLRDSGITAAVETTGISTADSLKTWLTSNNLPAVLKTDGSSGGYGVRVVHTAEEAEATRARLATPPGLVRALKRALINHNPTFLLPAWRRHTPAVNAQRYIPGKEITATAACWQGNILALLVFEVIQVMYPGGPASVVRPVENPAILDTIRRTATRLRLHGLCGFDFILGNDTTLHLIELNPRATQTAHLGDLNRNLATALFAAVTGNPADAPSAQSVSSDPPAPIALFPNEWSRDPASTYLSTGKHDVPWSEPALVEAIAATAGKRASEIPQLSNQAG